MTAVGVRVVSRVGSHLSASKVSSRRSCREGCTCGSPHGLLATKAVVGATVVPVKVQFLPNVKVLLAVGACVQVGGAGQATVVGVQIVSRVGSHRSANKVGSRRSCREGCTGGSCHKHVARKAAIGATILPSKSKFSQKCLFYLSTMQVYKSLVPVG